MPQISTLNLYRFAEVTYGRGEYGTSSTYSGTQSLTQTQPGGLAGGLGNTGTAVAGVSTIAALVFIVVVVIGIWRRKK